VTKHLNRNIARFQSQGLSSRKATDKALSLEKGLGSSLGARQATLRPNQNRERGAQRAAGTGAIAGSDINRNKLISALKRRATRQPDRGTV